MSNLDRILLFGFCGACGAAFGGFCGLVVADQAAEVVGDLFQFCHFAVVLAFIGAGIAIGTVVAHAIGLKQAIPAFSILAAATVGAASGLAGCVIAQELLPFSHGADFAAEAWGAMGGFLGMTAAVLLDRGRVVSTGCGSMIVGAVAAWLLFDPDAELIGVVMQAATLGFVISATIGLTPKANRIAQAPERRGRISEI